MARIEIDGFDALLGDLADMAQKTPELRMAILTAEADVVEPAVRQSAVIHKLVETGRLQESIGRKISKSKGIPAIRIGPVGEHHRYMPSNGRSGIVSAGYVGYIYEYGLDRRGIRARKWLSNAVEQSSGPAFRAAETVYDSFLKKHNL
jgi:hypothetical protein